MTTINHAPHATGGPPPGAPPPVPFGPRLAIGLAGVLVAAMMSGLNNRVGAIALIDVEGALGLDADGAHRLTTAYAAAELAAMPIAAWFAVTFSFRRFHMAIVGLFAVLAILLPLAPDYHWLLAMRAAQGLAGGAMIPLLMSAALRFLPQPIKLHGLGLYSLTATFSPNLGLWLAAAWVDRLGDWRMAYWQVVPVAMFALWAVWWGIPQDPVRTERLRQIDLPGLLTGPLGLALVTVGLEEGERLAWFHSAGIAWCLLGGGALVVAFLISEWFHHLPFVKLQLLERRNFWLGFTIFVGMLVVFLSGSVLPADLLGEVQGFRPLQIAPIGLIVAIPQLVLAPLVSALLYRKWVDARRMMALGLMLVAASCWLGAGVTSRWMVAEFWLAQACQMVGQPMAVIGLLFLATGVAAPMEGPFVSGMVNTLRTLALIAGAVGLESGLIARHAAHMRGMVDRAGRLGELPAATPDLLHRFEMQATTLAIADAYRLLGLVALALAALTFLLQYLPPPAIARPAKD